MPIKRPVSIYSDRSKHFAVGLNFYMLFWIFFIGCFLGVVVETIWCLCTRFRFESRQGLVYGPFNLVYGFGALLMTLGLYWLRGKRDLWVFLGGVFIGSVFEYACSWFQEMAFGSVSWQYETLPFNLHGRINLLYSIFWGLLAILWVKILFPLLTHFIKKIPGRIGIPLTWVLLAFIVVNSLVSGLAVARWSQRIDGVPAANALEELMDSRFPNARLERIYPNMVFVENDASLTPHLRADGESGTGSQDK